MIEVFTVGGGEYLVNVFNAVASWAGSGGYRGLVRVVMVMAFTWALLVTAWNMDPRALLKWFMQATLMYMVVMVPTISVKVTDRTNPGVTAAVVDNVATMPLVKPYVASEPDGPVVKPDRDFRQGASWYLDPTLAE